MLERLRMFLVALCPTKNQDYKQKKRRVDVEG